MKTAIVIGATGLTGTHLVAALLQDNYFSKVKVLVRQPWAHQHPGLESVVVDFDDEPGLTAAIEGDVFFSCIGTTIKKAGTQENFRAVDYGITTRCAAIARRKDIPQFLMISSIGANPRSSNFYLRTKGQTEEAILAIGFIGTYIFRPSFLIGERKEFRFGEWLGKYLIQLFYFLLQGRWKKYRGIKAATVAHAMVRVAKQYDPGIHIFESDAIQNLGI
ncbi:NAD(P)H-binding protein [Chitinophaga sp. G-6-1-13]|uniref:NAD(P)H-binding protein n=1 Tax=Chitinophaga fulva TaxID=2728842 RepID=A0A848GHY2_9BACT|nr:NAD(P)H-binding protein [Chitinophaga fulva]NML37427.1 NAD(P)H-binding protein [Chitinophaga fulva]